MCHRDVKSDNCLLDQTRRVCKITDFGLASVPADSAGPACCGTLRYMAPELTAGPRQTGGPRQTASSADEPQAAADADAAAEGCASGGGIHHLADRADVYAFGLLLYEIVHQTRAFHALTGAEALAAAQRGERPPLLGMHTSPRRAHLAELMRRCWAARPADRPCMAEVLTELERASAPGNAAPSTSRTRELGCQPSELLSDFGSSHAGTNPQPPPRRLPQATAQAESGLAG